MKKILFCLIALMGIIATTSCGGDKTDKSLLAHIPADASAVVILKPQAIASNAGITITADTRIVLPQAYLDLLSDSERSELDDINEHFANCGIDPIEIAGFTPAQSSKPIAVVRIGDRGKFEQKLESWGCTSTRGSDVTWWTSDDVTVGIRGSVAYMCESNSTTMQLVQGQIAAAKKQSMSKSPLKACLGSSELAIVNKLPADSHLARIPGVGQTLANGYVCTRVTLTDNDALTTIELRNQQGQLFDIQQLWKYYDPTAHISNEALAYMSNDQMLVGAMDLGMIDWDELINSLDRDLRGSLSVVKPYLKNIDGTVAIGVGLANGLSSIAKLVTVGPDLTEMPVTLVVETAPGTASSMLSQIQGLLMFSGLDYVSEGKGFAVNFGGVTYHADAPTDNMLVLSTLPIQRYGDCAAVSAYDLTKYNSGMALNLARDSQLMRELRVDYDASSCLYISGRETQLHWVVTLKGEGQGVLAKGILAGIQLYKTLEGFGQSIPDEPFVDVVDEDSLFISE